VGGQLAAASEGKACGEGKPASWALVWQDDAAWSIRDELPVDVVVVGDAKRADG
jgi:hypothetical protein